MKTVLKIYSIFILCLLCSIPAVSSAAAMSIVADKNNFAPNEEFLVQVFLDTEDVTVNAVGGVAVFPPDLLEVQEIRDGNSSINFWVEKPHVSGKGEISFSGITAGGFSGAKRFLFGVVFRSHTTGEGSVIFKGMQILQNDGIGTKVPAQTNPFTFSISPVSEGGAPANLKIEDSEPPEDFMPFVANDSDVFDGKYFAVFNATDKGTGIDHYQIREGIWSDYVPAESPYLLKDQALQKDILIKAVDKAGNERIVKIKARYPGFNFGKLLIVGILFLLGFYVIKRIWHTHG